MQEDVQDRAAGRARHWLALASAAALIGLAGCGGGGKDAAADTVRDALQAGMNPATSTYRMTTIGGFNVDGRLLNEAGQVAGVLSGGPGERDGFFHDGARIIPLGIPGGVMPLLRDMNEAGQVVGSFEPAGGPREAFAWSRDGGLVRIAPPSTKIRSSIAYDVNENGQVAGTLVRYDGSTRGFVWSASGGLVTSFGAGTQLASAYQINDAGLIAGEVIADGQRRPALVHAASGTVTLAGPEGPLRAATNRPGLFLNGAAEVAGTLEGDWSRAFFSRPLVDGSFVDLHSIVREGLRNAGADHGDYGTYVTALNDKGQVLVNIDFGVRTHYWSRQDGFIAIWPEGADYWSLDALNKHGVAVGWVDGGTNYALAWSRKSGPVDLNARIENRPERLRLRIATAINDRGQILVLAEDIDSGPSTVLLTPIEDSQP